MNREKLAWLASIVLIAVLALNLPGTLAQRDDDYTFVRTLVDIHRQVMENYADPPEEETLRQAAIDGMLSKLDPFTMYVPPAQQEAFDRMLEGSFRGVGIQLDQQKDGTIEVVTPIEGSPAFKAGVLPGDVILKVNGEAVEGQRLPDVIRRITGQVGTDVTISVRHADGKTEDVTITRDEVQVPTIKGYQRTETNEWDYYVAENPKVAYLRITQFTPDTYDKLYEIVEDLLRDGMEGLILDLRNNPGGRLDEAAEVVDMFIDSGVIVSTRGRNRPEDVRYARSPGTLPQFPMTVLVNENSASAAEIVAGSLMDNRRALVIGEQTYGKGSVQELIGLDGGGELKLTVAYYYLPSGRLVHRKEGAAEGGDWGVMPQIVVPMDQAAEERAMEARYRQELFRLPLPKAATQPSSTAPTTQPVDAQLQRAVDTMVALLVLQTDRRPGRATPVEPSAPPATRPSTQIAEPATAPGDVVAAPDDAAGDDNDAATTGPASAVPGAVVTPPAPPATAPVTQPAGE